MGSTTANRMIDLHCDTLSECYKRGLGLCNNELHFSLDRLPEDVRLCQVMAVFMPDTYRGQAAEDYFEQIYSVFRQQMKLHAHRIVQLKNTANIDEALENNAFAAILAVEGGSVLAGKLERLELLARYGVRLITLTWNAENEICGGSATQKGFTAFGRQVVRRMEELGIAVDVSHLSDRGFWELCEMADKPFLATHSNSRAVCNHPRNLTDDMFSEIMRRGGIVGLNYYDNFIREGGGSQSVQDILRHVHHFLELGGENTLALGSDFDGADLPPYLDRLEKQLAFFEALRSSGIPDATVRKIVYENARRYLKDLACGF